MNNPNYELAKGLERRDESPAENAFSPISTTQEINGSFQNVIAQLRNAKPETKSEESRRYAVTITELEKCAAYFRVFVVHGDY